MKRDTISSNPMYNSDSKSDGDLGQTCATSMSKSDEGKANINRFREDQLLEGMVLKKALVIFRHGARTPLFIIPNIPQVSKTCHDCSFSFDLFLPNKSKTKPFFFFFFTHWLRKFDNRLKNLTF